ncbi:hypothetical protein ACIF8Z_10930 [Pseudomonas promysalinigenes]|uniref:hypothetical protein n=1 Tax=Pseudomonas promysalinigenes TaxID=485898 RepID=UPI0037CB73C9
MDAVHCGVTRQRAEPGQRHVIGVTLSPYGRHSFFWRLTNSNFKPLIYKCFLTLTGKIKVIFK